MTDRVIANVSVEEDDDDGASEGAAASASLLKLKEEGLARLEEIEDNRPEVDRQPHEPPGGACPCDPALRPISPRLVLC